MMTRPTAKRLPIVIAGVLMVCLPALSGLTRRAAEPPAGQEQKLKDSAFIAEGAKLFLPNCSSAYCHGSEGKGGGAPPLRDKGLETAYLFKTISNGISGSPMRAFKSELSDEKIWQLVAYIMSPLKGGDINISAASAPGYNISSRPAADAAPAAKVNIDSTAVG